MCSLNTYDRHDRWSRVYINLKDYKIIIYYFILSDSVLNLRLLNLFHRPPKSHRWQIVSWSKVKQNHNFDCINSCWQPVIHCSITRVRLPRWTFGRMFTSGRARADKHRSVRDADFESANAAWTRSLSATVFVSARMDEVERVDRES